jgi:type I restriction-modification system DNA methylase subunit
VTTTGDATTDIGREAQNAARAEAVEKNAARAQGEKLFNTVLGELDAEGQAAMEAARQAEIAARQAEEQAAAEAAPAPKDATNASSEVEIAAPRPSSQAAPETQTGRDTPKPETHEVLADYPELVKGAEGGAAGGASVEEPTEIKAAGTGGKRGPVVMPEGAATEEAPAAAAASEVAPVQRPERTYREQLAEEVQRYQAEGHNINDHGVYVDPERLTIPFSKAAGRKGELRIAAGPDGKFRLGVSIEKNYGDFDGMGWLPAIARTQYNTRKEAIKAGIDIVRDHIDGSDAKGKAALKALSAFEQAEVGTPEVLADNPELAKKQEEPPAQTPSPAEEPTEIKAAGTGGKRGPALVPEGVTTEEAPAAAAASEVAPVEPPTTEEPDFPAKWDAMDYGQRQAIVQTTPYGSMRKVVHRLSGSKWAELSSGEQEEMRKALTPEAEEPPTEEPAAASTPADIKAEIEAISLEDFDALLEETTPAATTEEKDGKEPKPPVKKTLEGGGQAKAAAPARSLSDMMAGMAKEGVAATAETMKGLYELFGGGSLKSFPGGFDSETYAKAKPHFEAALEHAIASGNTLKELVGALVKQFGGVIKPYLKQFVIDKKVEYSQAKGEEGATEEEEPPPINLDENTGKGEGGERKKRRKLSDQEKAERDQKKAAAEEEKKRKAAMGKFENIGYVYDPEKLNAKIKDKTPKSAAKIILDEMIPSKVWRVEFAEGASPGTVRLHADIQKQLRSFKDYLFIDGGRLRYAGYRNNSTEKRIEQWLQTGGTIDQLKEWAQQYGTAIQPLVDAFKGQSSITNVIGKLQETYNISQRRPDGSLWNDDGTFPDYRDYVPAPFEALATGKILISPRSFYNFLTNGWNTMLADEPDILLSEINIHKRGLNKEISRSGLPDYREGIELKKTEDFNEPFNFKGVGFGESSWIDQEERNRVIPAAYDAFKDLAATIGAPDNGMSLGNNLAVQFANLGHKAKGAAAAYFPTVQTINFTRDNGDGTMAHEWGHGLQDLSEDDAKAEIDDVIKTFFHVYDFDAGSRYVDDLLSKDSTFLKRMVSNKRQVRIDAVKEAVTENFTSIVKKETEYYKTARLLDPDYTAMREEMWARAFEAYVYDTLPGHNNYLVNDFVAAGRVGGKSGVGSKLVYPSGLERETFNATIKHFLEGLRWEENHKPMLKDDYVKIELRNEQLLKEKLDELLATVEERYKAIWASEPSADGFYWYRYDETSFGPMMPPDGYGAYDKAYTSEGQNGTGAVGYLTQLHPDVILDYKLSNVQYAGEKPTYIKEGGGFGGSFQADGEEALDEAPPGPDRGTEETGDIRSGDRGSGDSGVPGTREPGKQRGTSPSGEGDSAEGVHPSPAGNYYILDDSLNDPRSVSVRFAENLAVIKVLKQIEEEGRDAYTGTITLADNAPPGGWTEADEVPAEHRTIQSTTDEKGILARYSGWGGMAELFSWSPGKAWAGKAELIKSELTEDEITGAEKSSISAYYTPVKVGRFMWKLGQRLGFKGGVVLDPATGANGLFFGTMPPDLAQSTTLQGIEMDSLSARIASKLYGLATIENKPFQDVNKPNNRFDLTITNVPFENVTPSDQKHNKGQYKIHNYFINKMLNLTAPGALSMVITTANTMDSVDKHLTEYAAKADLVGAIRLPSGIFSATNVVTDILVFRKKIEGSKYAGVPVAEWTTAGKDEATGLTINNYFLLHPEMVAGNFEKVTGRYGDESLRVVGKGDLLSALERAATSFPEKIVEREATRAIKSIDDLIAAPGTVKEGGLYINDKDEVCLKVNGEEEKLPVGTEAEKKKAQITRGFVHLLDQVRATLRAQKTETDDEVVKAAQAKLKKYYDAFVKKFGPVNDPNNYKVYSDATDYAWVVALEEYDPDTKKVTKLADIFTKNITGVAHKPERADTDHDALAMALDEFGYPNLEYMAKLRDSDVATVLAGVQDKVVENPETGFLETMDEYLSGNVKRKLKIAKEMAASNPEYGRNVDLLEAALPPDVPSHRITARIGASWIKPEHLSAFVREKMQLGRRLETVFNFNPMSNEWTMTYRGQGGYRGVSNAQLQRDIRAAKNSVEATRVWGTERRNFYDLIGDALSGKRPVVSVYDPVTRKTFMDVVATKAAEDKLQDIQWSLAAGCSAIRRSVMKRSNGLMISSIPRSP